MGRSTSGHHRRLQGVFIPLFFLGAAGEHRRIFDYTTIPELAGPSCRRCASSPRVAARPAGFQPIFWSTFVRSISRPRAEEEPVRANTFEDAASPPPHGNWAEPPQVYRGPYEYSVPGRERDYRCAGRAGVRSEPT